MEGLEWSATIRSSMRPLLVVVKTEGIELDLQVGYFGTYATLPGHEGDNHV